MEFEVARERLVEPRRKLWKPFEQRILINYPHLPSKRECLSTRILGYFGDAVDIPLVDFWFNIQFKEKSLYILRRIVLG